MNTAVKCRSENPAKCRFHAPNAGVKAKAHLEAVQQQLKTYERRLESPVKAPTEQDYVNVQETKWELQNAEDAYYGTPEGLKELETKMAAAEPDSSEYYDLKFRRDLSEAQVRENEMKMQADALYGGPLIPYEKSSYKVPSSFSDGDELWPTTTGEKYDPNLTVRNIATNLTADFKKAQKEGYLPSHLKFKVSPDSSRARIKVTIIGADDSQIWDDSGSYPLYTKDGYELKKRVEQIFGAYRKSQYDVIEGRTNYTTYWGSVEYETKWETEQRQQREEASRQKRLSKTV